MQLITECVYRLFFSLLHPIRRYVWFILRGRVFMPINSSLTVITILKIILNLLGKATRKYFFPPFCIFFIISCHSNSFFILNFLFFLNLLSLLRLILCFFIEISELLYLKFRLGMMLYYSSIYGYVIKFVFSDIRMLKLVLLEFFH